MNCCITMFRHSRGDRRRSGEDARKRRRRSSNGGHHDHRSAYTYLHLDGLRLDAIDAIKDGSAYPFLRELADVTHARAQEIGRPFALIAESDLNDAKVIRPPTECGDGMDAQWSDDFHHALHVLLTGERRGYYADFTSVDDLAQAFRESFVYAGKYSTHRQRRHGSRALPAAGWRFVVCSQNHDQVGNRATGDRLSHIIPYGAAKLAAASVLLSPFVPLLFMGEEYGEPQPFQYFTSHGDQALIAAVREGRQAEFASFRWHGDIPDPDDVATFQRSKLTHREHEDGPHGTLWQFYQEVLRLRRTRPALATLDLKSLDVSCDEAAKTLAVRRWAGDDQTLAFFNFSDGEQPVTVAPSQTTWRKLLDSADERWRGPGSAIPGILPPGGATITLPSWSFALFGTEAST